MAGPSAGGQFGAPQPCTVNSSITEDPVHHETVAWTRRENDEIPTTEGSLRALLNKLAPSDTLPSIARQVATHLIEDEAPDELACQLIDRVQDEPIFAKLYAELCTILVRIRSGYVFYRHLLRKCKATFSVKLRQLVSGEEIDDGMERTDISVIRRHRLRALTEFVCHLFVENLISPEELHDDYLGLLVGHLPDLEATDCFCHGVEVAGSSLPSDQLQGYIRHLEVTREYMLHEPCMRYLFMIDVTLELLQPSADGYRQFLRSVCRSNENEP